MTDITSAYATLIQRMLEGEGMASRVQRRAAFDNAGLDEPMRTLIDKVATQADRITDRDVAAVRKSGLGEDHIFELVVCAAIGQSARQYESARAALGAAMRKE